MNRIEVNYKKMQITCALIEGVKIYRFGKMLTQSEKEWLMAEVNDFLAKLNS